MTLGMQVSGEFVVEIRGKSIEQIGSRKYPFRCSGSIQIEILREPSPVGVR